MGLAFGDAGLGEVCVAKLTVSKPGIEGDTAQRALVHARQTKESSGSMFEGSIHERIIGAD